MKIDSSNFATNIDPATGGKLVSFLGFLWDDFWIYVCHVVGDGLDRRSSSNFYAIGFHKIKFCSPIPDAPCMVYLPTFGSFMG